MRRILLLVILSLANLGYAFASPVSAISEVENEVLNIAVSPDGQLLALVTSFSIRVYRFSTGVIVYTYDETESYRQSMYANLAWSPDGSHLVVGKLHKGVRIWDTTSWEIVAHKSPTTTGIDFPSFAWSPDGNRLAIGAGGQTREILIWNKDTDIWTSLHSYTGRQVSVVWATDGQLLVMAEQALYDASTGNFVRDLTTPIDGASGYAVWSPDTKLVFVFFDLGGSIRDSETNTSVGFSACCYLAIAWSMDGLYLAAASKDDNEIWVWNAQANNVSMQERQGDVIYAFAWLPNNELLAAGSINGHDTIWNTATGKVLLNL